MVQYMNVERTVLLITIRIGAQEHPILIFVVLSSSMNFDVFFFLHFNY